MKSPKPKDINVLFRNAKSRFTLGQINKLGQLLDIVGLPDVGHDREQELTFDLIKELHEKYKQGIPAAEKFFIDAAARTEAKPQEEEPPIDDLKVSEIAKLVEPLLPPPNPAQKAELLYFQKNAAYEAWLKIKKEGVKALLARVNTGDGKTYWAGQLLRWLIDSGYFNNHMSPFRILYVTKASIVEQTKRVLRDEFGLDLITDVNVVNYDALRSSLGELYLRYHEKVQFGERIGYWEWRKIYPLVVVHDECQSEKNEGSDQSKIMQAYNDIENENILQFFLSATPFSRVSHAKVFAVATRIKYLGKPLTNITWNAFANDVAGGNPAVYSKTYMHRFIKEMHPWIIGFKNVKRKFKGINHTEFIDFDTTKDAETYRLAWDEYLEKKKKYEGKDLSNSKFMILVQLNVFRQKAEILRARILARKMWQAVSEGKAALCACCYKPTIAKAVQYLYNDYAVSRDQISLIWGGDAAFAAREAPKYSWEQIEDIQRRSLMGEIIPAKVWREIMKQLEYANADLGNMPKELDLGVQTKEMRQYEIDKFQSGRGLYCFFTFQAGGAGLSLHHNKPELRQRRTFVTPTYNEMEMLQALGRAPRITSLSNTEQSILLFRNTIEVDVLSIYKGKKSCLDVVIDHSESAGTQWKDEVKELIGTHTDEEDEGEMSESDYEEMENQ